MQETSEDRVVTVPDGDDADQLRDLLARIGHMVAARRDTGRVADYIPALARVDARQFGLAVARLDGSVATLGDASTLFSIQSISKVFMLALALGKQGNELWKRVGREPSGTPFNSIVQLERENGLPRNPFINAGAIVVADVVLGESGPDRAVGELLELLAALGGEPVAVDEEVAASEARTGERNRALSHFMRGYGNLLREVEPVLATYFRQCAVAMSCTQLARAALFLANGGINPLDGSRVVRATRARRINAIMVTCGHYDASGDFAFRVGLPGKSGVGGGIVVVAPGRGAACVWSPGLDQNGNSLLGALALEMLAAELGWSVYG